ncbi:unnamed protein product (macronuclear) [Paramecium tetraurelia]|uniref:Replication protein A C-terminal domain-containing protein n=1 Tax=Paramecium tetraurelia TaxID=5888 RepID=A0DP93_PARTE|nr:uncharacterized protein GSPATT00019042001 [Paramecium tetraurelia]CAK84860.1 unnamed protein product [Paramecium tetraurelia]|eukprot:XP_001452257.1 hypothetical protein (macronuclear) [Paramecium tetraurelia strain d4-2]
MFQQSQFSEQKNQSGFKQGVNYNEQVTNMTIRMMKKLKISVSDKNEILFHDKPITLIQVVARAESSQDSDGKGSIVINDDSGFEKISILFSEGDYVREMFNIVNNEEPKTCYFQFLLRTRIRKEGICFDIMNIKKVNQIGQVISHMLNIIQQTIKSNHIKNPNFMQTSTQIVEEEQFKPSQQSLSDKILNFIKQFGDTSIPMQKIINMFSDQHGLQDIKQSIRQLYDNGSIQQGQGVNTYMLVD